MKFLFPLGLVFLTGLSSVKAVPPATPSPSLELTATNGAGSEKHLTSQGGRVPQLVIKPDQTVPIKLQFPSDKSGMPVVVSSLDGGEINGGQPIILPNGNFLFTFRAHAPGLYRLMVILANGEQHQLQFYAIDPKHPRT